MSSNNQEQRDGEAGPNNANGNNSNDIVVGEDLSMNKIIDFLKDQQRASFSKDTEFIFEKQQMLTKINQLTAQLKAQENINNDLIKRIKMLEFSLRQERIKYAKLAQGNNFDVGSTDIIGQVMQKANLNTNLYDRVAKRRAKAQRPLLLKFLQEIGYDDIFNVDEVNEIKALYDKAQEEMKENFQNEMANGNSGPSYVEKLEEKMLLKAGKREANNEEEEKEKPEVVNGQAQVNEAVAPKDEASSDAKITSKFEIRGHFDSVRDAHYSQSNEVLATVSEDCQIKLWHTNDLQANNFSNPFSALRGHAGPLYCLTGPRNNNLLKENKHIGRLLFSAGEEGVIRIWSIPSFSRDEKYPQTDGKNNCVGMFSTGVKQPYWHLEFHYFLPLLAAVKSGEKVQIWDCEAVFEKVKNFDSSTADKNSILKVEKPTSELSFEVDGKTPGASACCWLSTDSDLIAVGYSSAHLAFFNFKS